MITRPSAFEAHGRETLGKHGIVYAPLSRDDLMVCLDDLKGYASSVAAFWTELADALEAGD